jgi:recombination protein RecA
MQPTLVDPLPIADHAIPTHLAAFDEMLGTGGLPCGRILELFGEPECGKTTFALNLIAAAQQFGAKCVLVDAERTYDARWAETCGVRLADLTVLRPDSGEQAVVMIESLLRTFSVDFLVVDSAAALVPEEELEASLEDAPEDLHLQFLTRSLRRISTIASRSRCAVLFLNQARSRFKEDGMETSAGARALAQYAAIRIRMKAAAHIFEAGRMTGRRVTLLTLKNKLGEPYAEAGFDLVNGRVQLVERKGMESADSGKRAAGLGR